MRAGGAQRREASIVEATLEQLVRQHRVGDRGLAEQAFEQRVARVRRELLLEQLVDQGVDAADEERCYRVHVERLRCSVPRFERSQILLDHAIVHRERKDERDIHVAPVGEGLPDRRHALERRGNLDHEVGAVDPLPERPRHRDGAVSIVRQRRRYLEAHVSVGARGAFVDRAEQVRCVLDIGDRELRKHIHGVVDAGPGQLANLVVVQRPLGDRLLKDCRVAGQPCDVVVLDTALQLA